MNDFSTLCDSTTFPDIVDDGIDMSMSVDFDGDGFAETTVMDTDGNGIADVYAAIDPYTAASFVAADTDGDGVLDVFAIDADGDGEFEEGWQDADGDGVPETEIDPSGTATTDPSMPPFDPSSDPSVPPTEDPNCDVCDVIDADVHGDPMAEIPYHQAQVGPNDCLPTSVAMVLTEAGGVEVPQSDVVDLANELDLLGPDGMTLEGGVTLLEHWGVEAEVQTGSLDDLRTLLDQGTPVIIGLDADDLYGMGDQPFADDLTSGHAVVITGIDDEAGLVYVNDPAFPDGAGVAVPIADFEDAWIDADNSMIVADLTASDTTDASEATEATVGVGREAELSLIDLVLLPLRLVVR